MAQTDDPIDRLFSFTAQFAHELLVESGDFYPFGATIAADGTIVGVGGDAGGNEHPQPLEVYRSISDQLVSAAAEGNIVGAAVVAQVTVPTELGASDEDGIRVHIEAPGFARFIYVPYKRIAGSEATVELSEPLAVEAEATFFV